MGFPIMLVQLRFATFFSIHNPENNKYKYNIKIIVFMDISHVIDVSNLHEKIPHATFVWLDNTFQFTHDIFHTESH